jgi:hypothetical protein
MKARGTDQRIHLIWVIIVCLAGASQAQTPGAAPSPLETRAEREAFLLNARIVNDTALPSGATSSRRVVLEDRQRRHDAGVETADGSDPTRRSYKFNVAAYELDKVLGLNLVVPSVERIVNGRPASVTWWLDDFVMTEQDRRRKKTDPPDLKRWNQQVQAVRVFDELISNTYRDPSPPLYLNSVWDNLLITRDWTVWLTDHTGAFRIRGQLLDPESLAMCPRTVLATLRDLNRELLARMLGKYLSSQHLEALEVRRTLVVRHFEALIASKGEAAVLYDLPPRR